MSKPVFEKACKRLTRYASVLDCLASSVPCVDSEDERCLIVYPISANDSDTVDRLIQSVSFYFNQESCVLYRSRAGYSFAIPASSIRNATFLPISPVNTPDKLKNAIECALGVNLALDSEWSAVPAVKGLEKVNSRARLIDALRDYGLNAFGYLMGDKVEYQPFEANSSPLGGNE